MRPGRVVPTVLLQPPLGLSRDEALGAGSKIGERSGERLVPERRFGGRWRTRT